MTQTDKIDLKEKFTAKERYDFLIKAKNFHYDNYNKWLTYFYVAIGALFVGYYTLTTSNTDNKFKDELLILISLGYIVSLLWYWSSKGYYFWNINFITLVNDCEEKDLGLSPENRVYYTFANKKTQNNYLNPIGGANISTSKIAIFFSFLIALVWGTLLINNLFDIKLVWKIIGAISLTLLLSLTIPQMFFKSKIDHFPDLKINQKQKN
jgi:hypothetical protein